MLVKIGYRIVCAFVFSVLVGINPVESAGKDIIAQSKSTKKSKKTTTYTSNQLYQAALNGDLETTDRLLQLGVTPNTQGYFERDTPLFIATHYGHIDVVDRLLEAGANINLGRWDGMTPLFAAVCNEDAHLVKRLLKGGASPNIGVFDGSTPLHEASRSGYLTIINLLLSHGAAIDANPDGITPLSLAAYNGRADAVKQLLRNGANLWALDEKEQTILMDAAIQNHSDVIEIVLSWLAVYNETKRARYMNQQDKNGDTALMHACRHGSHNAVMLLLHKKVDLTLKNGSGHTALEIAEHTNHAAIVTLLNDAN